VEWNGKYIRLFFSEFRPIECFYNDVFFGRYRLLTVCIINTVIAKGRDVVSMGDLFGGIFRKISLSFDYEIFFIYLTIFFQFHSLCILNYCYRYLFSCRFIDMYVFVAQRLMHGFINILVSLYNWKKPLLVHQMFREI